MANVYRFSLKSEELRGAGQPNIVRMNLASDADAILFAGNLEVAFAADVVTVDLETPGNYAIPYPVGTGRVYRVAMRDATSHWYNEFLQDVLVANDPSTLAAQLVADGILLPTNKGAAVQVIITDFTPGASF